MQQADLAAPNPNVSNRDNEPGWLACPEPIARFGRPICESPVNQVPQALTLIRKKPAHRAGFVIGSVSDPGMAEIRHSGGPKQPEIWSIKPDY
jgi:hypothetical protein